MFNKESDFEAALIQRLTEKCGWDRSILKYKSEEDLIQNWAQILYENNQSTDRLNHQPLIREEMQELMEQIRPTRTPVIFITARGAVEDRVKGLRAGADDWLKKPYRFDVLLARMSALLRKQR